MPETNFNDMDDRTVLIETATMLKGVQGDVKDIKTTNEKQWKEIGKTNERVANIEGQLEAGKDSILSNKKVQGGGVVSIIIAVLVGLQQLGVIG